MLCLLICYCLFILYGSFIPFRLTTFTPFVQSQWDKFWTPPYAHGARRFSILDVVSNVLLFLPFGFFWMGSRMGDPRGARPIKVFLATGSLGFLLGLAIELGQLFSPGRTSSLMDAICNGTGAAIGGTTAYFLFRGLRGRLGMLLLRITRERPSLILLVLLLVVPTAAAFYPFQITLDVSTAWENLKQTQWVPFTGDFHRFWLDLVIEKVVVFAVVAFLVFRNLSSVTLMKRSVMAWAVVTLFSFLIEAGKLLFVGRVPNIENVIVSSIGAFCGVLFVPPISNLPPIRRRPVEFLMLLTLILVAYSELTPFDWIQSVSELRSRFARIEWLPLASYYKADPQSAVFDLGKKVFLMILFGFLLAAKVSPAMPRCRWSMAMIGTLIGIIFEACQILLRTRIPSVTDTLTFGVAAWIGAALYGRYQSITTPERGRGS